MGILAGLQQKVDWHNIIHFFSLELPSFRRHFGRSTAKRGWFPDSLGKIPVFKYGMHAAQSVARRTGEQYWQRVRVPGAKRDFYSQSPLSTQTVIRCPYRLRVHQHLCARSKFQTLAAIPLFEHTNILHELPGMGSAAAFAAAVALFRSGDPN